MEIKRILWPTDFSAAAASALPYVTSLSRQYQAEIHLLHVAEDLTRFEHYWGSGPDRKHIEELHKYALKISQERLTALCANSLDGCPRYHIHIILGDPAKQIIDTIEALGVDLVVLATHGVRGNFPFGSVAEKVVKNSSVPVLTVNPTAKKK
jgi:nucleotide-binding universal stress UspA family protein